ncbi:uncharacterized protein [Dysidea avara]|uniref:uncharacterized protein n=1 Tax=Dysidea avara TaxID=196820 RepID=UPI003329F26C
MASGGDGQGSQTVIYFTWMYECLCVERDDGSGQDYQTRRHFTSILMQYGEVVNWLSRCINTKCTNPSDKIVIGIAPGACMVTESDINYLNSGDDHVTVIPNLFEQHQEVLQVVGNVAGKVVCILDDVWTTGRALRSCHQLVTEQGAKNVCLLSIGETDRYHMIPYYGSYSGNRDTETIIYLKMGTVRDKQRKTLFLSRVYNWVKSCIEVVQSVHPTDEIVLGIAPGHAPNSVSFMTDADLNLFKLQENGITIIPNLLQRYLKVEKQATSKKKRSPVTHLNSIKVVGNVAGKVVCILDDVWTSGSTLSACCQLVAEQGAVKVYPLSIGETVQK